MYSGYRRHCLPIVTSGIPNEPLRCALVLNPYSTARLLRLSQFLLYIYQPLCAATAAQPFHLDQINLY